MHLHWLGGFESRQGASYTLGLETEECKSSVLGDCEMGQGSLETDKLAVSRERAWMG